MPSRDSVRLNNTFVFFFISSSRIIRICWFNKTINTQHYVYIGPQRDRSYIQRKRYGYVSPAFLNCISNGNARNFWHTTNSILSSNECPGDRVMQIIASLRTYTWCVPLGVVSHTCCVSGPISRNIHTYIHTFTRVYIHVRVVKGSVACFDQQIPYYDAHARRKNRSLGPNANETRADTIYIE